MEQAIQLMLQTILLMVIKILIRQAMSAYLSLEALDLQVAAHQVLSSMPAPMAIHQGL